MAMLLSLYKENTVTLAWGFSKGFGEGLVKELDLSR